MNDTMEPYEEGADEDGHVDGQETSKTCSSTPPARRPVWDMAGIQKDDIPDWQRLSKTQLKKRLRYEAKKVMYQQEKRKGKKARLETTPSESACTEQQSQHGKGEDASLITKRRREKRKLAALQFRERSFKGPRIIVDCEFDTYMTDREFRSMYQQLSLSYHANREPTVVQKRKGSHLEKDSNHGEIDLNLTPARLVYVGVAKKGEENLKKKGIEKWEGLSWTSMGLSEYLEAEGIKHDAIYLTADAPATKEHIVENIESSKVYIIGGLVDRNRHKGLTYRKADELGLRTARLPIEENVTLIGSPSLTTNHVVHILVNRYGGATWEEALRYVLPERRIKKS